MIDVAGGVGRTAEEARTAALTAAAPPAPVEPTPPAEPLQGILVAATRITEADDRWIGGVTWVPEPCSDVGAVGRAIDPDAGQKQAVVAVEEEATAHPFYVAVIRECSTLSGQDRSAATRRLLDAAESALIERELWTGEVAVAAGWGNPFLADGNAVDVTADTPTIVNTFAELEAALAGCLRRGMIHLSVRALVIAGSKGLLRKEAGSNLITTWMGSIVVPGAGYPGTGPGGATGASGTETVYATGRVALRRSTVEEREAVHPQLNRRAWLAERAVAATFDPCCHFAATVDLAA
ncbi:MAG TPA: hypothetical protein VGB14_16340 [Acidimicrobiales bacterium]|jgi:hypothetical protein